MASALSNKVRTGACLCKNITFRVTGPEIGFVICHCQSCQRNTGTAYTANAWFPTSQFEFTTGSSLLKLHNDSLTESGRAVQRWFCSNCGSPMLTRSQVVPEIAIVPSGLFDEKQDWNPSYEQWLKSKMCFDTEVPGVPEGSRYQDRTAKKEFEAMYKRMKSQL